MSRPLVIAVDGPAASGKGTIAAGLARDYGLPHLDTGLLYRAVGVLMARAGRDLSDEAAAAAQARSLTADLLADPGFRTRSAGEAASRVAIYPQVREACWRFSAPSPARRAARSWMGGTSARSSPRTLQ